MDGPLGTTELGDACEIRSVHVGRAPGNVIILTGGWTGSSVLAGLLQEAGFWAGQDTVRNTDYDTHENAELVRLNREVMARVGLGEEYASHFRRSWLDDVAALARREDESSYRAFVEKCERQAPWVWKDPRLWVTIRFWQHLIPGDRTKYLLLTREPMQAWISCILRKQIQTYAYLKRYSASIEESVREFLVTSGCPYMHVIYEDLLVKPESELERLSRFLETPITMAHLQATYNGSLHRRNRGIRDAVVAGMVYVKNYNERLR